MLQCYKSTNLTFIQSRDSWVKLRAESSILVITHISRMVRNGDVMMAISADMSGDGTLRWLVKMSKNGLVGNHQIRRIDIHRLLWYTAVDTIFIKQSIV